MGCLVAAVHAWLFDALECCMFGVLHGESITGQASPRTPTQRTFQPQIAVQPQRNQTMFGVIPGDFSPL